MRDLAEININDGGEPVTRPAPTEADYEAFESKWQVKFPPALRQLLAHSNGGHPEIDGIRSVYLPDDWPDDQEYDPDSDPDNEMFGVDHFFQLQEGDESTESFSYWINVMRSILGPAALPFAVDGGGNIFYLDTSEEPASTHIWLHEEDETVPLTDSFEEFIDALQWDPDMI